MKNPAPRPEVTSALLSRLLHNNVDAAQRAVINRTGVKVQARRSTPVAKASPQPPPQELRCASVSSRRQCGNVALGAGSGDQVKLCRRHLKARHPRIVARWDKDKRRVRHGNAEAPVFPSDLAQLIRNAPSVSEAAKNARQRPALTNHDAAIRKTTHLDAKRTEQSRLTEEMIDRKAQEVADGWHELSDEQIRHVATLLGFTLTEQTKQVNAATHTKGL